MIILKVENNAADDHAENSGDDLADGRRGHWEAFIPLASCVACQPTGDQSQTTGDKKQKKRHILLSLEPFRANTISMSFLHMTVIFWRENELFSTFLWQILIQNSGVSKY